MTRDGRFRFSSGVSIDYNYFPGYIFNDDTWHSVTLQTSARCGLTLRTSANRCPNSQVTDFKKSLLDVRGMTCDHDVILNTYI